MEMCPEVQSSPAIHASQQNRSILIDSSGAVAASLRGPLVSLEVLTPRVLPEYSSGLKTLNMRPAVHCLTMMQKQGCIFSRRS